MTTNCCHHICVEHYFLPTLLLYAKFIKIFVILDLNMNFILLMWKTNFMQKVFLYLSAFIPLYCLIIIKLLIEIINKNLTFNILNTTTLILMLLLIGLGIVGIFIENHKGKYSICKIKIIKKTSITEQHFLGYFSLFVLFALTFELERISMFVIFLIIIILIGIVYIKNDLFYINPLLNILGYNFYDIEYLDDKNKKHNGKFFYKGQISNNNIFIARIGNKNFNYIYKE